jgi:trimeric autotransporter adhesin
LVPLWNWIAVKFSSTIQPQQKKENENMTTLHLKHSINRSPLRLGFLLIPLVLVCFTLSPTARAVSPAPDGGYPGFNTAEGELALQNLTGGSQNTALGFQALFKNTTGNNNTSIGVNSLFSDIAGGNNNTATGNSALQSNSTGTNNTATGNVALFSNMTGNFNTATGGGALFSNTTGRFNTAIGLSAGNNLINGEGNIYIGAQVPAGATGEFEFIRIGNDTAFAFHYDTFIAGIYLRAAGPSPLPVMCGSNGKLSANASSRRFKHDIKPIENSEVILALKPVAYHYNNDATNSPDFGLIAEDVAEVAPDLVIRDEEGKPLSVHYQGVNAMLLKEFIKEHKKVEEQQASISQLRSEMQTMVAQLKEQAAQIQKVSAQLQVNKSVPQVVNNNP